MLPIVEYLLGVILDNTFAKAIDPTIGGKPAADARASRDTTAAEWPDAYERFAGLTGRRREPRYRFPFEVSIVQRAYRGVELSLDDFTFAGDASFAVGGTIRGKLNLLAGAGRRDVDFTAAIESFDGGEVTARFVDLDPQGTADLSAAIGEWLHGDDVANPPSFVRRLLARDRRLARIGLVALIGLVLNLAGLVFLYGRLTTITPAHAAVAGDAMPVQAPESGVVHWLATGARVEPGQPIGAIASSGSRDASARLDQAIDQSEQRLAAQQRAARDTQTSFAAYQKATSLALANAQADVESATLQADLQRDRFQRMAALAGRGFVSRIAVNEEQAKLAVLQAQLADARRQAADARLARSSARNGFYASAGRSLQPSPLDMRREAAVAAEEVRHLRSLRAASPEAVPFVAPCRCRIIRRYVRSGEYAPAGTLLGLLDTAQARPGRNALQVESLIPLSQVAMVEVGAGAELKLPGSENWLQGRVTKVTFDLASASKQGLPSALLEAGDAALVVVEVPPQAGLRPVDGGMPSDLRIRTSLARRLGL